MGFTNTQQLRDLLLCGGMGFWLGLYYDGFRLIRLWCRPSRAGVFCLDMLYGVTAAPMVFLFALAVTDGSLRWYLSAGLLAGFFAYRRTVGRAVIGTAALVRRTMGKWRRHRRQKAQKNFQKPLATKTGL